MNNESEEDDSDIKEEDPANFVARAARDFLIAVKLVNSPQGYAVPMRDEAIEECCDMLDRAAGNRARMTRGEASYSHLFKH